MDEAQPGNETMARLRAAALLGLAAALAVVGLRLGAWFLTGSLAVLADTIDPALNVVAALVTLGSVVIARRPADDAHPYGHRALEHVAVGVQGALALAGALLVGYAAYLQLSGGAALRPSAAAVGVFVASVAVNSVVGRQLEREGRGAGSPALIAAGRHTQLDALVALGVLLNLLLIGYSQVFWLDILVSALIIAYVTWHALRLIRRSALGLLETADDDAQVRALAALEASLDSVVVGHHDLRCRDSAGYVYVDFHLQFADGVTLEQAHWRAEDVEDAVEAAVGGGEATAHLETVAQLRDDRPLEVGATGPDERGRRWAAAVSLTVAMVLMMVKMLAAVTTGSAAVLSDALESIVNVLGAGFAMYSVRLARSGTDRAHPYGHHKIEFLAAGFEGTLIGLAGVLIIIAAVGRLLHAAPVSNLDQGLALLGGATIANGVLGAFLVRQGRRLSSLTLVADGKHVLTDVWTSLGVLGGLGVVRLTGWQWADPAVALLVALSILRSALILGRHALDGVLDTIDAGQVKSAEDVLEAARATGEIVGWHGLRVRDVGERRFVDAHIQIPDGLDLAAAHGLSEDLEERIAAALAPADVILHAEPADRVR